MESDNNITYRKPRRTSSLTDLSFMTNSNEKTILDTTMMSIPDSLHDNSDVISQLTDQNKTLTMQLLSAHQEIENLNSENFRLKTDLQNVTKTLNTYKKICSTPEKKSIAPVRKNQSMQKNSPSCLNNNELCEPHRKSLKSEIITLNKGTQTTYKCTQTSNKLKESPTSLSHEIREINKQIETNRNNSEVCSHNIETGSNTPQQHKQNKICILSSNKQNNVLSIAEETIPKKYKFCHYLTPDGDICHLLKGIDTKLTDYTMNDYCVIFVGEKDFKISYNYSKLILNIRKTLSGITHTNIIICLPTYKYNINANMYNWRVRNFNYIMYQDISAHKHVFVLDSNANLSYDYNTFYRHSGQLNDFGLRTIFMSLLSFIKDIEYFNTGNINKNLITLTTHEPTHVLEPEKQFFR